MITAERRSISRIPLGERRRRWSSGIPALLYEYGDRKPEMCSRKLRLGFNTALEIAGNFREKGALCIGIYFCGHCFRYHLGNKNDLLRKKVYCVWCGNWVKKKRLERHKIKCNYRINLEDDI